MNIRKIGQAAALACGATLALGGALWAITATEMDDFQGGTTEGWANGTGSPAVTNENDCGPAGTGDRCLQVVSTGTAGPASRLVVRNTAQWTGDYNALGSEFTISMDVNNDGGTTLALRVGISTALPDRGIDERWVTTNPVMLGTKSGWQNVSFTLSEAEMTDVSLAPPRALSDVLADVQEFRILSSTAAQWQGDQIAATLQVDNIQVTSLPVGLQSFSVD